MYTYKNYLPMKRFQTLLKTALVASLAVIQLNAHAQTGRNYLKDFPKGDGPQEIGKRIAEHFVEKGKRIFGPTGKIKPIIYPITCTWLGSIEFAEITHNRPLQKELAGLFQPLFGEKSDMIPVPDHVDFAVFGIVPFALYRQTKDKRYLQLATTFADKQWGEPYGKNAKPSSYYYQKRGMSWETRMWIDDMYMITALQTQAYQTTGKKIYLDRAAKEMIPYLDSLQQPNGLFYHAPDVPFFWGRGDGWMAVGMTEMLRFLPKNHPGRPRILKGYLTMMKALLKYQAPSGMWHQLIDDPTAWEETSSTGMFTYAFITGVKEGWLNKDSYGPAARKAWLALIGYINDNDDIRNVCEGTNKKNDRQYYLDRKQNTGDLHGQAPLLWCATALLR